MCHRAGAMPVHRRTSCAPLLSLPARPQRSRDRPLHPVDRVIDWVHRPRSLLHGLRRGSPLHRAYRVNSPANATRHEQPGQKSHLPALPRKRTPGAAAPCYADASTCQEVDVAAREAETQSQPYSHAAPGSAREVGRSVSVWDLGPLKGSRADEQAGPMEQVSGRSREGVAGMIMSTRMSPAQPGYPARSGGTAVCSFREACPLRGSSSSMCSWASQSSRISSQSFLIPRL